MCRQRELLVRDIFEQVSAHVPELELDGNAERRERVRTTIGSVVGAFLDAIEREAPTLGGALTMPPVAPRSGRAEQRSEMLGSLTRAERRVLDLACEGLANKQIASALCASPNTVHAHLKSIFRKLEVRSRRELAGGL